MEVPIKIFAACTNGNVEVVQQLIASGLDINEPHFSTQGTPLHLASIAGKRRVVKLLLKNGALVDAVDQDGRTALHHAVAWVNVRTARTLIKFKANVNAQATSGHAPLALAAHKGCSELVQLLLERNADPDVFDAHGRRALHDVPTPTRIVLCQSVDLKMTPEPGSSL